MLLPERTVTIQVYSEVLEEWCLHKIMKVCVEVVSYGFDCLEVA